MLEYFCNPVCASSLLFYGKRWLTNLEKKSQTDI